MADAKGTTVIHGNHGFFMFDGNIVGRVKNVNMTVEGGMDEFYEMGSAWVQDLEVINKKVQVEIERGSIDFRLLAYSVGVQANLTGSARTFLEAGGNFDLVLDEAQGNLLSVSPDGGGTQVLAVPFTLDVAIAVNKIIAKDNIVTYFVTARDCKIMRHGITAPQSAYWTTNISMTGKQIGLSGLTPFHTIN